MEQKMQRAEALRAEQREHKLKKAKEAQEKFLVKEIADKKRKIRSISMAVQKNLASPQQTEQRGAQSNRSESQKAVAFYVDLEESAKRWPELARP